MTTRAEVRTAPIYLDNAATTSIDESVLEAMLPYLRDEYGNASSLHGLGRAARRAVERAREQLAACVGADARSVVFTSGATEADNLAVFGTLAQRPGGLITSLSEHPAVLAAARRLEASGRDVLYLRPAADGSLATDQLVEALARQASRGGTALVSLMMVNNETGVITSTKPFADLAHAHGALFMTDAVQAFGLLDVGLEATGADLVTLSGHKVHGPKGVGALIAARGAMPEPLLAGGAQERGVRPGTHAVHSIVGFGEAARLASDLLSGESERLAELRQRFEDAMCAVSGVSVNGAGAPRSPRHSNLHFAGVESESLVMALDDAGICASSGSACAAGSPEASHVLTAMGLGEAHAKRSVRFSFGRFTTSGQITEAVDVIQAVLERCRRVAEPAR